MNEKPSIIVVGGGLAGLSAAMRAAENGLHVKLVSLTRSRRSHSVCAQGGINAALNMKDEKDSPFYHAYDTIKGGDFLADQPPVVEMCLAGPGIIHMLERFGCPFNRTVEGTLDVRRFGGTLYHRTVFCNSTTGQQLLYTLDDQVRKHEVNGEVERFENHEFLRLILDDNNRAVGIVMMDINTLELIALTADAVLIATGGLGFLYGKSTNSTNCTGAANARLYIQGVDYANGEFIQIHPTAIPGHDKLRLISESVRGEGGRVWVYGDASKSIETSDGRKIACGKTGEPWYFLEELYPAYGNLVARDVAAREILRVYELGLGIHNEPMVYLDVRHLAPATLKKIDAVLEIYEKYTGDDPRKVPMKIFPAVHYSMGGAFVDWPAENDPDRLSRFRQMTNIQGCFNAGESDYLFHGANRLGANSLLSCIFSGLVAGDEMNRFVRASSPDVKSSFIERALHMEVKERERLFSLDGPENLFLLHEELAEVMMREVTVKRDRKGLERAISTIISVRERLKRITLSDKSSVANGIFRFAHEFTAMIELAHAIAKGALLREESRGSHFRFDFPEHDEKRFLKTTIAHFDASKNEPMISYRPVDLRHFEPEKRDYTVAKHEVPEPKNLPKQFHLPV